MRRLKYFMLLFCLVLSIPTALLLVHTHGSLEQEEKSELRYFANSLFDRMEEELALLIQKEEGRAVDDYTFKSPEKNQEQAGAGQAGILSGLPQQAFILGYFQNNPDGGFQTPLMDGAAQAPPKKAAVVEELQEVNRAFNRRRMEESEGKALGTAFRPQAMKAAVSKEETANIADKYFALNEQRSQKDYLGSKAKRLEQVPAAQALNVAPQEKAVMSAASAPAASIESEVDAKADFSMDLSAVRKQTAGRGAIQAEGRLGNDPGLDAKLFQVEVDPMQSVLIDSERILIFRRIVIRNQVFRQGFVLLVRPFFEHLLAVHFSGQPMARFTNLRLQVLSGENGRPGAQAGIAAQQPRFSIQRTFPRPFAFVQATLACDRIPASAGRRTWNLMVAAIALIFTLGLFAIYRSARTVTELAERRATFVSSVTHELKTPLTNIRMYIEMLEQGIAQSPEREREYLQVLLAESGRLTRLINNVLEFSKLEKKHRQAALVKGDFDDVIAEIRELMQEKLRQEGFSLDVDKGAIPPFPYDREMMIQILINLMENSLKFARNATDRRLVLSVRPQGERVLISLSDAGPGIPPAALKKIFDDFFRVDSEQVRTTQGTGIGLALVRKLAQAMGGSVSAANNPVAGCTITVSLPRQ